MMHSNLPPTQSQLHIHPIPIPIHHIHRTRHTGNRRRRGSLRIP
jgi:hypothetical protein